jgi:DNA-directed RNA polymerase subunit RPC12/RpoP
MVLGKLNKWTMDFLKKSIHKAELVKVKPKWTFTCFKCAGKWTMGDESAVENIFDRPHVSCPHCGKKARPAKT